MSQPSTRYKPVPPKQKGPIRNRLTRPPAAPEEPVRASSYSAPESHQTPTDAFRDALECGVRTAYTVINDYMRRGYEAARANQNYGRDRGDMRDDTQSYSGWNNAWNPMGTPLQQWAAMMRAWTEAWAAFMPGAWQQQMWSAGWPGYGMPGGTPPISVQVRSHRRADVTTKVNLMPGSQYSPLTIGHLAAEGSKAALKGVSITCAQGTILIEVPVQAEQPAGAYCGEIRTPDGRAVGNLTVTITDLPGKSA